MLIPVIACLACLVSRGIYAQSVPRAQTFSPLHKQPQLRGRTSDCQTSSSFTPWVFAQFRISQAEEYDDDDWLSDVQLAYQVGFDGFALTVGTESWGPSQVHSAYAAAQSSGLNFKLFITYNMSELTDASQLLPWVSQYGQHDNQFIFDSKVFVSTLGGDTVDFDSTVNDTVNAGWNSDFKQQLRNAGFATYFVPSFPDTPVADVFDTFSVVDGIFSLDAWSTGSRDEDNSTDVLYQTEATGASKSYMMPISGHFFEHGPATGNQVYRTDDWALASRWEQAIQLEPSFVQVLSWNGFDDSTYIGPMRHTASLPSYVTNMAHTPWLLVHQYYIQRYKTGSYPAIDKDTLVYWYRTHSKDATATKDALGKPSGWNNTEDAIYILAFAASDNLDLEIQTGSATATTALERGLNKVKVGFETGDVVLSLSRNGTVLGTTSTGPAISNAISTYNFNVHVGTLTVDTDY